VARAVAKLTIGSVFKVAYFAFLAALAAIPVQLVTGNSATRAVVLGLLLVSAVFTAIGFQRRP
jgi:ammonia channel protein AmtB